MLDEIIMEISEIIASDAGAANKTFESNSSFDEIFIVLVYDRPIWWQICAHTYTAVQSAILIWMKW